jgi:hypothetical protein
LADILAGKKPRPPKPLAMYSGQKTHCVAGLPCYDEWMMKKNARLGLLPYNISKGSGKSAWWKCKKCGFEWFTRIANRARGHGCRRCANKERKDEYGRFV